jgi:hypothetical protein
MLQLLLCAANTVARAMGVTGAAWSMHQCFQGNAFALCLIIAAAAAAAAGKCVLSFNDQLNAEQHVAEALKALKA